MPFRPLPFRALGYRNTENRRNVKTETKSCRKKDLRVHGKAIKKKAAFTDAGSPVIVKACSRENRKAEARKSV